MTALQEFSARLSLFSRSFSLYTFRQSLGGVRRQQGTVHISSTGPVVDWHLSCSLSGFGSGKCLSHGPHALQPGSLERNGNTSSETDVAEENTSGREQREADTRDLECRNYANYMQKTVPTKVLQVHAVPNYLTLSDKELFAKCRMDTYRASGPGGQHRNKTESAVRLTHIPTGLVSQAADDRSQHINRALALTRLRQIIAVEVRDPVELEGYSPPPELVRILPSATGGKRGNSQKIGPNHPDFVLGIKALLDLLWAVRGSVSHAGTILGISTGAVSKLITSNNLLWQGVNKLRASEGLKPLR